eukprot:1195036-Prorocentrum_minimum.AAC.20
MAFDFLALEERLKTNNKAEHGMNPLVVKYALTIVAARVARTIESCYHRGCAPPCSAVCWPLWVR